MFSDIYYNKKYFPQQTWALLKQANTLFAMRKQLLEIYFMTSMTHMIHDTNTYSVGIRKYWAQIRASLQSTHYTVINVRAEM